MTPKLRRKSRLDSALQPVIIEALRAGNGRSNIVKSDAELIARLAEDGHSFDPEALFGALSVLIVAGRVLRRTGVGMWLHSGCNDHLGEIEVGLISAREQRLR